MSTTTFNAVTQTQIRHIPIRLVKPMSNLIKILLWVVAINIAMISLIYGELFMFPHAKVSMNTVSQQTALGPVTQTFIEQLKKNSFSATVTSKVKRAPLTVDGRTVTLGSDNFQVFEYSDSNSAKKEAALLAVKYASSTEEVIAPENSVHIYTRDKLVIFYMGSNDEVISSLEQTSSPARAVAYQEVSVVSKGGQYFK